MTTITASELQKKFGKYQAVAQREPITVTSHGRESVVIMSVSEHYRLKSLEDAMSEKLIDERISVHEETLLKLAK